MKTLAYLVLLSAIAIAGCAAYFSVIGLKLLFVGSGVSIVVMGIALEVGKFVTVTFLKQKWNVIGRALKTYLVVASTVLMLITSIGIYGYLSAGYNATSLKVKKYETSIISNNSKIEELQSSIDRISKSTDNYNTESFEDNRKDYIQTQNDIIKAKEAKIKSILNSDKHNQKSTADMINAKKALDAEKEALNDNMDRELQQIELYNNRLKILDDVVQHQLSQGDRLFKKDSATRAREIRVSQKPERDQIDNQIKQRQQNIDILRSNYDKAVEVYNSRMKDINARLEAQKDVDNKAILVLEADITNATRLIEEYNSTINTKIQNRVELIESQKEDNKKIIDLNKQTINDLLDQNHSLEEQILNTDVGTFRFVASNLGLSLDQTVTYFIWAIIFVFDPLAVGLVICFNYMIQEIARKKKVEVTPPVPSPTPVPVSKDNMKSSQILGSKPKKPKQTPPKAEGEVQRLERILEAQRQEKLNRHKKA